MQDSTVEIILWAGSATVGVYTLALGWLYKMLVAERSERREESKGYDQRLKEGVSHTEAEQLIEYKMQPLRDALERNTQAVTHLTQVLIAKGLRADE